MLKNAHNTAINADFIAHVIILTIIPLSISSIIMVVRRVA